MIGLGEDAFGFVGRVQLTASGQDVRAEAASDKNRLTVVAQTVGETIDGVFERPLKRTARTRIARNQIDFGAYPPQEGVHVVGKSRIIINIANQNVFDDDAFPTWQRIVPENRHQRGQGPKFCPRNELVAEGLVRCVQGNGGQGQPCGGQSAQPIGDAYRGNNDFAPGKMGTMAAGQHLQRVDYVREVEQRFPHSHKDDSLRPGSCGCVHRSGGGANLGDDFMAMQIADIAGVACTAEGAPDWAANLCRDAECMVFGHDHAHAFNSLAVRKLKHELARTVRADKLVAHWQCFACAPKTTQRIQNWICRCL